jgi:nucleoside-diphosphate-sugar epimerase
MFNNDQHCVGWNEGRNPLPLILVGDVAEAVAQSVTAESVVGRAYNLVGNVRLDARTYFAALATRLGRPLQFHASNVLALYLAELGKWLIKRAAGRAAPLPSLRDLKSRGLVSRFDCTKAERDLNWSPVSNPDVFLDQALGPQR